jgi:hypothetical protein
LNPAIAFILALVIFPLLNNWVPAVSDIFHGASERFADGTCPGGFGRLRALFLAIKLLRSDSPRFSG